jgi:hypothetical protein
MKALGFALIVLGVVLLATAGTTAPKAPNASYLVGTFLAGLVCLIVGLKLGQSRKSKPDAQADSDERSP